MSITRALIHAVREARSVTRTPVVDLTECIETSLKLNGKVFAAKNRDRAYKPELEVVHEIVNGTEIAYLRDVLTDWSEGLNEHGIGILNTALRVDYDEQEGEKIQKGARPSKDGARIRRALAMTNIEDAVKSVTEYQGGVKGHTIIVSNDLVYTVEVTSKHKPVVTKHRAGTLIVRTNHGDKYTDAGYTPKNHPEDYESSVERHDDAVHALRKVSRPEQVLAALRNQPHKRDSNLNMFRDTDKLFTSSQILLNVTDLVLELDWMSSKVAKMHGVNSKLPKGYEPKITIDIQKLTDKDITHMQEQSRVTAGTLLSTLKQIQDDYKGGQASNCAYEDWDELSEDAEYDGKNVTLNKPFRTPGAERKFGVYVKNDKGNVVLVRFGDPNMEIKRDDPDRRSNYRARHGCDDPGPKWKANYWSCKMWAKKSVSDIIDEATNTKAVLIAVPKDPHAPHSDKKGYWKIGDDVYRASVDGAKDMDGLPMDKRWESSFTHFARYWHGVHDKSYAKTKNWK